MKRLAIAGVALIVLMVVVAGLAVEADQGAVKVLLYKGLIADDVVVGWVIVNITGSDRVICELHMCDPDAAGETYDAWLRGFEMQNEWSLGGVTLNEAGYANVHIDTVLTDLTATTAWARVTVRYQGGETFYRTTLFPVPTQN